MLGGTRPWLCAVRQQRGVGQRGVGQRGVGSTADKGLGAATKRLDPVNDPKTQLESMPMNRLKSTIRKAGVKDGRYPGGVSFKHMDREGLIELALGRTTPGLLRKAKSRERAGLRARRGSGSNSDSDSESTPECQDYIDDLLVELEADAAVAVCGALKRPVPSVKAPQSPGRAPACAGKSRRAPMPNPKYAP